MEILHTKRILISCFLFVWGFKYKRLADAWLLKIGCVNFYWKDGFDGRYVLDNGTSVILTLEEYIEKWQFDVREITDDKRKSIKKVFRWSAQPK